MDSNRKIAIAVGVLFIIATGAALVQFPLIEATNAPDYLVQIAAHEPQMVTALLFDCHKKNIWSLIAKDQQIPSSC